MMRKMNNKKTGIFISAGCIAAMAFALAVFSCRGRNSVAAEYAEKGVITENLYAGSEEAATENLYADTDGTSEESLYNNADESAVSDLTTDTAGSSVLSGTERKLIVTWDLSLETENYDDTVEEIRNSVEAAGGYIESENETSYSDENRYLNLTIRIPEGEADNWVETAASCGTVTGRSKNTEDETLQYVDTESRLEALRTEQESLESMMEKATDVSDLITIQSELTEVNAEIEWLESSLLVMDNQVDYTTVYLNVEEVNRVTSADQTLGQEIRETFLNSLDRLKLVFRNLAVGILGNSVIIILVAAGVAAIVCICRKIRKHRRDRE